MANESSRRKIYDVDAVIEHCLRSNGSTRAWFLTREAAEVFAADPANWPIYRGDIAHKCLVCGLWHLSRFEWLFDEPSGPIQ
jgi:hypothetical protein